MKGMLKNISWLFFAITLYLILADAVQPWMHLPKLDHGGFTIVFVLFSLVHCAVLEGQKRTTCFFAISAFISYVMEEVGVRTGFIYGHYHYSNMLGPKAGLRADDHPAGMVHDDISVLESGGRAGPFNR